MIHFIKPDILNVKLHNLNEVVSILYQLDLCNFYIYVYISYIYCLVLLISLLFLSYYYVLIFEPFTTSWHCPFQRLLNQYTCLSCSRFFMIKDYSSFVDFWFICYTYRIYLCFTSLNSIIILNYVFFSLTCILTSVTNCL